MTKQKGLSGSTLKIIAIVTMLIDHIAAVVLARMLRGGSEVILAEGVTLYDTYTTMRNIGRIAFPIFCFLLVEGFEHTRNRWKYASRLGIFALISEIPFDLALTGHVLEFGYQNVYFTLFVGVLTMMLYREIEEKQQWNILVRSLAELLTVFAGMGIAQWLRTDYGALGVFCIMVLYIFRRDRKKQNVAGTLSFCWWEPPAIVAFIPLAFYNGTRGINLKYVFYIFYPVHLLILYLVCQGMGIAGISAI